MTYNRTWAINRAMIAIAGCVIPIPVKWVIRDKAIGRDLSDCTLNYQQRNQGVEQSVHASSGKTIEMVAKQSHTCRVATLWRHLVTI